ncbi:ABC transporter substrate-binding protein [Maritalea porphyrae]|uniref:ABC transporter substrate-binding protein n=1 Tax=Maritalea porphyrae TaxID=880732 RepID=UPI0022AFA672|nr:sugar ABC transporter substrate-binding protein [Maritalea porphyrae]MCZ4272479.1 sugar ABC transporter substrate-binding protein [Maritalea porphyrae]
MNTSTKRIIGALLVCNGILLSTAANAEEITIWSWDTAAEALKSVSEQYNATNPALTANTVTSQVYDQLTAGCAAGGVNLPDVVSIENGEAERYIQQFPDCFVELSQFGVDELKPLFSDYKWVELQSGDNTYGVPWDAGQVVTFYRADLFDKAGITADDIATWDGYIEAGKKLAAATNGETRMALSNYTSGLNWFSVMAQQLGCSVFGEKNGETTIRVNQAGCVRALDQVKKLADAGVIAPGGWSEKLTALKTGKTASAVYGAWYEGSVRNNMPELSGQWRVTKMPAFEEGGKRAANLGGSALFITASSKNPAAAYDFVKFALTKPEIQIGMLKSHGLVPSLLSTQSDEYMSSPQEYWGGQTIWKTILETSSDIEPVRATPYGAEAGDILVAIQTAFVEGKYDSAQAALDEAAKQIKNATGLTVE